MRPRAASSGASLWSSLKFKKRSISGISDSSSFWYRWTRHPTATTAFTEPCRLSSPALIKASIDSLFAASMKPHVFTSTTSAVSSSETIRAPWPTSSPSRRSESTVALSHPSEMTPSLMPEPRWERSASLCMQGNIRRTPRSNSWEKRGGRSERGEALGRLASHVSPLTTRSSPTTALC